MNISICWLFTVKKIKSTIKIEKAFTKTENYVVTQNWMCICLESIITFKLFAVLFNATFKIGIMPCYNLLIAIPSRSKGKKYVLISNASSAARFNIWIWIYIRCEEDMISNEFKTSLYITTLLDNISSYWRIKTYLLALMTKIRF